MSAVAASGRSGDSSGGAGGSSDASGLKDTHDAGRDPPYVACASGVLKSVSDDRDYRGLSLPGGLRALLVSDAEADAAAAALDVHVGHFSDPDGIAGLAHFCEHMLFLGTERFPDETAYKSYLSAHGGSSNASTSTVRRSNRWVSWCGRLAHTRSPGRARVPRRCTRATTSR